MTRGMVEGHRLLARVFRLLPDYAIRKVHAAPPPPRANIALSYTGAHDVHGEA
jgi:hypothetical protein